MATVINIRPEDLASRMEKLHYVVWIRVLLYQLTFLSSMNAMYGNYDLGFLTPDEKEPTDNKRKYVDIMNHNIERFIDDQKYKNTKRKTKKWLQQGSYRKLDIKSRTFQGLSSTK